MAGQFIPIVPGDWVIIERNFQTLFKLVNQNITITEITEDVAQNASDIDALEIEVESLGMNYKYIISTGNAEGDIHLSDATHWGVSKANIKLIHVETLSTEWDLWLVRNDNGYAANDAAIPAIRLADGIDGNANLRMDLLYYDEDDSDEVHLYFDDKSGANTADITIEALEAK